jgi:hypothetical protein
MNSSAKKLRAQIDGFVAQERLVAGTSDAESRGLRSGILSLALASVPAYRLLRCTTP